MKNMKKFVAAFAAAAMAMSMGVSAFAEVIEAPEKFDAEEMALVLDYTSANEAQITMMAYLVDADATGDDLEYTNQTIIALDQNVGATGFATIPIDEDKLEEGKSIVVKIGGSAGEVTTYLIALQAETKTYSVTISYNGGTGADVSGLTFDDDDTIAAFFTANPLTAPTKIDPAGAVIYTFEGWATAADAAVDAVIDPASPELMTSLWGGTPADSVTLYAIYSEEAATPAIAVTFMNGKDVHAVVEVDENGKVAAPATNPTLAASADYATKAYTFVEWVTEDGTAFDFDAIVEASTVVYPKFKSNLIYGDVTGDGLINAQDRTFVHAYVGSNGASKLMQTGKAISEYLPETTIAGNVTMADTIINAQDRTFIHAYVSSNGASKLQMTGQVYYVINK